MSKLPIAGCVLHSGPDLPRLPGNAVAGRALSASLPEPLLKLCVVGRRIVSATEKLMLNPSGRQLEQRAEEARTVAAQMRDPEAKRIMITLAVAYERLAKFSALREASDQNASPDEGEVAEFAASQYRISTACEGLVTRNSCPRRVCGVCTDPARQLHVHSYMTIPICGEEFQKVCSPTHHYGND